MQRKPVKSSNIKSVGYDKDKNELEVEFTNGSVYLYHEVPAAIHDAFVNAMSVGKYFAMHIKSGYSFTKIS